MSKLAWIPIMMHLADTNSWDPLEKPYEICPTVAVQLLPLVCLLGMKHITALLVKDINYDSASAVP